MCIFKPWFSLCSTLCLCPIAGTYIPRESRQNNICLRCPGRSPCMIVPKFCPRKKETMIFIVIAEKQAKSLTKIMNKCDLMAFLCLLASFSLSEDDTDNHQKYMFVWGPDVFDVPYIFFFSLSFPCTCTFVFLGSFIYSLIWFFFYCLFVYLQYYNFTAAIIYVKLLIPN